MENLNGIHEECGVFGCYSQNATNLAEMAYYGLYALQHRGQESCGIVVCEDGIFTSHKDLGLVNDVFSRDVLEKFPAATACVGHVRYGTTGGNNRSNCQPIEVNHQKGKMALAHNGNISNAFTLRNRLELNGAIFHSTSDTEIIAYIATQKRLKAPSIEEALCDTMEELEGAYSLVLMSATKLLAARDPLGMRPLCYGKTQDGICVVASESCALEAVGATFIRELMPGEILVFDENGIRSIQTHCGEKRCRICIFEYIYFARPDSIIQGVPVHEARVQAGRILARKNPVEADVVIGVPDSGLDAALGYAQESGIPYEIGFIKNKYIGRTFIAPGQQSRVNQVRIKLNPIRNVVEGKRVVLVDDSIVRGTTSGQIVKLLRNAGAREVHMRISAPPFLNPCYYGTDIDTKENLIACHYSVEEIAEQIGVDTLSYLPTKELKNLIGSEDYCSACFDGDYPTPIPENTSKARFEGRLSQRHKS